MSADIEQIGKVVGLISGSALAGGSVVALFKSLKPAKTRHEAAKEMRELLDDLYDKYRVSKEKEIECQEEIDDKDTEIREQKKLIIEQGDLIKELEEQILALKAQNN